MAKWHDAKVMEQPDFKVGDQVMLNAKNITTKRPSKKLDNKNLGPFKITEKVGNRAYRLELPETMKVHDVYHVSLLEPYREAEIIPGRRAPPPPPIEVDGEQEYEVEGIGKSRKNKGHVEYLVLWKGYGAEEATWMPLEELSGAMDTVKEFHRRYPRMPKDTRVE